MRLHVLRFLGTFLLLGAGIVSASDTGTIVRNCNDCHGIDGISQWPDVPIIAGMPAVVHEDALFIYRDKERPCSESKYRQGDTSRAPTTMCAVAGELSDEAIKEIAAHYAALTFVPAKQEFDAALAVVGEAVHKKQCDRCHSDGGSNPDDEAGLLAGQQIGYLRATLEQYASGAREQSNKMKEKMDLLSSDDVNALLHYYASQQ
jgi:sulfide dehydrogenase cytochrome subunit